MPEYTVHKVSVTIVARVCGASSGPDAISAISHAVRDGVEAAARESAYGPVTIHDPVITEIHARFVGITDSGDGQ